MTVRAVPSVRWSTPSFSGLEGGAAGDLSLLGAHFAHCNGCKSRWFAIRCAVDALDSFVAPRFITTVLVIGVVVGVASLAA